MSNRKVRLGVNIDHVATLKQVRAGLTPYPNLLQASAEAVKGGAHQITIHLREDRRHIQDQDVVELCQKRPAPINLEMAVRRDMVDIALKNKPHIVCFVPERRQEVTTEGGLDVTKQKAKLRQYIKELNRKKIKSSLFIEASLAQVEASAEVGAYAVEFHTGSYALASTAARKERIYQTLSDAAVHAHRLGLHVHAGHGLDYENTKRMMDLPYLEELNIGHSIVCRAVYVGLRKAVREMRQAMGGRK